MVCKKYCLISHLHGHRMVQDSTGESFEGSVISCKFMSTINK